MADSNPTILDVAKANCRDANIIDLVEENLASAPEFSILPARVIPGTSFKSLIRTDFPRGQFRDANQGTATAKSTYINKLVECFFYDSQLQVDEAIAGGAIDPMETFLAREASGAMKGAMLTLGSQFYYGTSSDAKGFPGAQAMVQSSLLIDAGGTTASTGSSVYGVVAAEDMCRFIFGNNSVFELAEWFKQRVTVTTNQHLMCWLNNLKGYVGAQFLNKYCVGRIWKLTADSGKGLTDDLLAQLIGAYPVGVRPTHLFMSRRSRTQLQRSRTVTINTGAGGSPSGSSAKVAPTPTDYEGIPIIATDSIVDTEALS